MSDRLRYEGGLAAEAAAERLYLAQGARVLDRRARTQAGEIDLIVEHAGTLIFVEVKARRTHADAAAALSARQQARILAAAEVWMATAGYASLTPCQFDVVTVAGDGSVARIENALGA